MQLGRKPLPPSQKLVPLPLRVLPAEKTALLKRAAQQGHTSLSDYLRTTLVKVLHHGT